MEVGKQLAGVSSTLLISYGFQVLNSSSSLVASAFLPSEQYHQPQFNFLNAYSSYIYFPMCRKPIDLTEHLKYSKFC